VYVVTSQMGFEALLWQRPLRCFGQPFYAGWGLSVDEQAIARRRPASLDALVHAALVDYPRQVHPHDGARCTPEALVQTVGWLRQQRQQDPERVTAVGFSWWKRPILQRFMPGSQVLFQSARQPLAGGEHLVLWGKAPLPDGGAPASVRRIEDGFLRSVGLGAEMRQPLSWVVDAQGLYYDATAPSQLEQWLQTADLQAGLRARAAALRQRILAARLTKYNLAGRAWQRPAGDRPVALVVGQVEADESLRWGAPGLCRNADLLRAARAERPDAWLIYKPHPDVVAGLRRPGEGEQAAHALADEVLTDVPIDQLLEQVDEVHVLTSLAGFEALLRQRRVVCWGAPFYAGWGLTDDRATLPRRQRRLDLDDLVAASLIVYPRYVDPASGLPCTPEQAIDALLAWRGRPPESRARRTARRWVLSWARRLRGR
jgi:capsular polysaccharide export protein